MAENQDRESELRGDIKAGQRTSMSGCAVALLGLIIPLAMFSIPSLFPCSGECQIGWAGIGFAMVFTPVLFIAGIALSIAGSQQSFKAEMELYEGSNLPPDPIVSWRTWKPEDGLGSSSDRTPEFKW